MEHSSSASKGRVPQKIWKFLTAFACHEGGGGWEVSRAIKLSSIFLLKNHLGSLPDYQNVFCTKVLNAFGPLWH